MRKTRSTGWLGSVTCKALLPVIRYTEQTAYEHARVWAELESSGYMIGFYDLFVAVTAVERGSHVATVNKRHFARIQRRNVIEPK
jgi:predicted nucleic acid-binding protein